MADIELVIKIDEEAKKAFNIAESNDLKGCYYDHGGIIGNAIKNGTPLPKGHGRLIDKDHMIARLEAASKFYGGENTDAFDERFSHGLKEAAIKVAEEPTIIEADTESEERNETDN